MQQSYYNDIVTVESESSSLNLSIASCFISSRLFPLTLIHAKASGAASDTTYINIADIAAIAAIAPQYNINILNSQYSDTVYVSRDFVLLLSEYFKTNSALTYFNFKDVCIPLSLTENTTDSYVTLAKGLEHCSNLTYLDLSDNNISSEGLNTIACAIRRNRSLMYLNLSKNKITIPYAKPFNEYCTSNKILYAYYNNMSDDVKALLLGRQEVIRNLIVGYKSSIASITKHFIPLLTNRSSIVFMAQTESLLENISISRFKYEMLSAIVALTSVFSPILSKLPKELQIQIFELSEAEGQDNLLGAIGI